MEDAPVNLSCHHCGKTFQRREHRDRHLLRHSGSRPFRCALCSKTFARSDTLQRHRTLHQQNGQGPEPTRRCPQACIPCARLKQRCEGGSPCSRCLQRRSTCRYKESKSFRKGPISPQTEEDTASFTSSIAIASAPLEPDPLSTRRPPSRDIVRTAQSPTSPELATPMQSVHGLPWHAGVDPLASEPDDTTCPPQPFTPPFSHATWQVDALWDMGMGGGDEEMSGLSLFNPLEPTTANFPFLSMMEDIEASALPPSFLQIDSETPECPIPSKPVSVGTAEDGHHSLPRPSPRHDFRHRSRQNTPCSEFPQLRREDIQEARAEMFGHVHCIPTVAFEAIQLFYDDQRQCEHSSFINLRVFHAFIELYFEYFDHQFPFLHPTRVDTPEPDWLRLLGMATIGSEYSKIDNAHAHGSVLYELLERAIDDRISTRYNIVDPALMQALLLRHIGLMYSGSKNHKTILQYERSILATMCRDLAARKGPDEPNPNQLDHDYEWHRWLSAEEDTRLLHCIYMFECVGSTFMELPTLFNLADLSQRLPCPDVLWRCVSEEQWRLQRKASLIQPLGRSARPPQPDTPGFEPFVYKIGVVELFADERRLQHQLRYSPLLRSLVASRLGIAHYARTEASADLPPTGLSSLGAESALLDEAINSMVYRGIEAPFSSGASREVDTTVHVLAILRHVPLRTLFAATGWKTDEIEAERCKAKLRVFFHRSGPIARKCLWHAACIFATTRNTRHFACYDTLNLCLATCYIWVYDQIRAPAAQTSQEQDHNEAHSSKRPMVRLDKLQERSDVEEWIRAGADVDVHLTGVGVLDGSDCCIRFLREVQRTLRAQTAWKGISHAIARSFGQLGQGEIPTMHLA
ncbi:hypothetical protein GQ53DRAFT_717088 [Thozetella sp. PMI_491]|nr:hypothetical protein GQ53DRAFT_717088 [Thozetella sp. PMI_491]